MQPTDSSDLHLRLHIFALRDAIVAGAENLVYLLLQASAHNGVDHDDRADEQAASEAQGQSQLTSAGPEHQDNIQWPGYCDVQLYMKVPRGASYQFHRDLSHARGLWALPDLPAGTQCIGTARILMPAHIVPDIGDEVSVAGVRLRGSKLNDHAMTMTSATLVLPVLGAGDYAALPEDEFVREYLYETASWGGESWGAWWNPRREFLEAAVPAVITRK